jgi:plasmid stabilization system protein ParE
VAEREVRFHPLAADEAEASRTWYFSRNPSVAAAFLSELSVAIDAIQETPTRWPRVHERYRRFVLHKFPFSIVYIARDAYIEVIAVAHHRRKPGFWSTR